MDVGVVGLNLLVQKRNPRRPCHARGSQRALEGRVGSDLRSGIFIVEGSCRAHSLELRLQKRNLKIELFAVQLSLFAGNKVKQDWLVTCLGESWATGTIQAH